MKHNIILISGKQGSGKTTVTNALILKAARKDFNAMGVIFAQTIYDIHDYIRELMRFRGIERPHKDGKLLQLLGTEWGRNLIDENVWVDALIGNLHNIAPEPKDNQLFVVSDCRFKNEFDGIDAFRVRLEAPREIRKARCDAWRDTDTHPSEIDLDEYAAQGKFDVTINTVGITHDEAAELILTAYMEKKNGKDNSVFDTALSVHNANSSSDPSVPTAQGEEEVSDVGSGSGHPATDGEAP
jgi:dephospho-CoA kinase